MLTPRRRTFLIGDAISEVIVYGSRNSVLKLRLGSMSSKGILFEVP